MFCPKCGTNIPEEAEFCTSCGANIKEIKNKNKEEQNKQENNNQTEILDDPITTKEQESPSQNTNTTTTEMLSKKSKDFLNPIIEKLKNFTSKYKKELIVGTGCLAVIIISIILFNIFYDFTKIKWDKKSDAKINYTTSTKLKLKVIAYDKEKNPINDIKFKADKGKVKSAGTSVEWSLPNKKGKYTITASAPSGKKIRKTIELIDLKDNNESSNYLAGIINLPEEKDADNDKDGLTNTEEKKYKTNIESADTDGDGITDYYEINETKTDPLKGDTDGDNINDGDEKDLNLDPLKKDSKGDGISDDKRDVSYTVESNDFGVSIEINGKGNIASSTIDVNKNTTFSNMPGLLDKIYNFYSTGTIKNAKVRINYSLEEIEAKGLNETNLTLYYFNEKTKELESIQTTVDTENKQIIAELKHFSKYVIGDKNIVLTNNEKEIMFVIDNSVSMYSKSQMIEAGYESSTGAIGNDIYFKRLTLTNKLIDMFTGNYKFGVAEFSGNYVNLNKFNNNHKKAKQAVNSMKSNWNSDASGTNIVSALKSGISEFTSSDNTHYLILLTDGKNTSGSLTLNKDIIITKAKENNVKVCVIGLGNKIDTGDLSEIAKETGCAYYNASSSSALDEIYSIIGADINYNYVDTNNDNKVDGMIEANSGFLVNRDGFPFANYVSNKSSDGNCYGMALFAMLYYQNQLPYSLAAKDNSQFYLLKFKTINLSSEGYDLTNTYFTKGNNKLYDFKIKDEGLDILLGKIPGDYRNRIENKTWMINNMYRDHLERIGANISTKDYKGSEEFNKYQSALLILDSEALKNGVSRDEYQMLNAIWRLFILQAESKKTSFSSDPDLAFEELKNNLSNKTPQLIGINGNHAINATRLIHDTKDSNKFKIEVYDNNYPGETRYIDVTRSKYSKFQLSFTAWNNEYNYEFKYDSDNDGEEESTSVILMYSEIN